MRKTYGLIVIIIIAAIYAYLSPSIAFRAIQADISNNDIDTFSEGINKSEIRKHIENKMSLAMHKTLDSYQSTSKPDPSKVEAALTPYFKNRSSEIATTASIFNELRGSVNKRNTELKVNFKNHSVVSISWNSVEGAHEVILTRYGLTWKLTALDFPNAMPVYWGESIKLKGTYVKDSYSDCCFEGNANTRPYNKLILDREIDIIHVFGDIDPPYVTPNISQVQIGGSDNQFKDFKDNDSVIIHCKGLRAGINGHYALPVYCDPEKEVIRIKLEK